MNSKQEALEQVISLINQHAIKINEIKEKLEPTQDHKSTSVIKKLFGFIGGIFILCGLGIYISQHWTEMNSAARIIITLGTGICLFILAVIASHDIKYEKTLTPLFMIAALFETGGMFVTIKELFHSGQDPRYAALVVFGAMFVQQIIVFGQKTRTSLLFAALVFGLSFILMLFDLMDIKSDHIGLIIGLSLICICYGLDKTKHHSITPFWYLIGSASFLCGIFEILQNTALELLYLGISIFMIYLSTVVRSRMLVFTGTVSMIGYIGYFTAKHFVNSIGWPIALIIFGIIMLGISAVAVNIGKSIKNSQ